ncbi:hypothetical protein ACFQ3X_13160 [Plantactinospora endophytica]|uniref:UGSC-like domain-containing protein n=1 Tax=Plantactinospora endophytica TaxID=673535 RepID=A0ABQ4EA33_9ACTN|nr:hypothetical protein [Plantactinospora endophytica]GIG91543.1 hypothetical protein Pen02_64790 [Plantactinospora endophytica]
MADGILLERNGIPAVSICTEPFRIPADAMAKAYGFPGFQYLLTPHPVASLTLAEVRQRVVEMTPRILAILGVEE